MEGEKLADVGRIVASLQAVQCISRPGATSSTGDREVQALDHVRTDAAARNTRCASETAVVTSIARPRFQCVAKALSPRMAFSVSSVW